MDTRYRTLRKAGDSITKHSEAAEGVIRYTLEHRRGAAPPAGLTAPLRAWFAILRRLELLGQRPDRYAGHAYGNLSRRAGKGLLVTCTQSSGKQALSASDFTRVIGWSLTENRLCSTGPCPPSSETLTHAMIYESVARAAWVFHVHAPRIWRQAETLGLPITDPAAEYGTPRMAHAVAERLAETGRPASGVLSMGGHEDGILAWGATAEETGCLLLATLARALAPGQITGK